MKIIKLYSLLVFTIIASILITSCVEDSDFEVPQVVLDQIEPDLTGLSEITFSAVKSAYEQELANSGESTFTFENNVYITGYVVSNDAAGNFFEELIIQNTINGDDSVENPRLGIQLEINVSSLYQTYEVGRKVYVKLNGLSVGLSSEDEGVLVLGKVNEGIIGQIETYEYTNFVLRSTEVVELSPKVISLAEIDENDINTLVQIPSVQFNKNEIGLTFAGEISDDFDGERVLESCEDGSVIIFQTSTFSDFKSLPLPVNSGTITGILTKDFFGENNVLKINSFSDISFELDRCDPVVLECIGSTSTSVVVFEEDFEGITNESQLDSAGWTNINVSGGNERYEDGSFSGDTYLQISAFGTGEDPLEAWLVTPAINLDSTSGEELTFDISSNFETGQILTAFITEDYTGDPTTTEWIELDANIPIGDDGFGSFVNSTINISCLNGDVHVAFKYLGAADGAETRYHIDDIKVTGE